MHLSNSRQPLPAGIRIMHIVLNIPVNRSSVERSMSCCHLGFWQQLISVSGNSLTAHLMIVEGRDNKPGILSGGNFVLAIKEPALRHDLSQVRSPLQQLIVGCDRGCPAAQPAALGLLEAEQTCKESQGSEIRRLTSHNEDCTLMSSIW